MNDIFNFISGDYKLPKNNNFTRMKNENTLGAPNPQDIEDMIKNISRREDKTDYSSDDILNKIYINGMKCGIRCILKNIIELCESDMDIKGIKEFCKQTLSNYKKK